MTDELQIPEAPTIGHSLGVVFAFYAMNLSICGVAVYYWLYELYEGDLGSDLAGSFNNHAVAYFNIYMQPTLFYYILGSFFIGLAFIFALIVKIYRKPLLFVGRYDLRLSMVAVTILTFICFTLKSWVVIFVPTFVIFASFVNPVWIGAIKRTDRHYNFLKDLKLVYKNFSYILLLGCFIFTVVLFAEFIIPTPRVMNAFMRIPEEYKLKIRGINHEKENIYINTTDFINDFQLFGWHDKIDINNQQNWKDNRACIPVNVNDVNIEDFVRQYEQATRPVSGSFWKTDKVSVFPPMLYYAEDRLCVLPAQGSPPIVELQNRALAQRLMELGINPSLLGYLPNPNMFYTGKRTSYVLPDIVSKYLQRSITETGWSANTRGELKHHIYYLYPSYEYLKGKPLDEISHQYGLGNTLILAWAAKIFGQGEVPSYAGALKLISTFWYISFFVFVLCAWLFFKNINMTLCMALILLINYLMRGYDVTLMIRGVYELRVLFDMVSLYFLFKFSQNNSLKYFISLLFSLGFGMFINLEFGLFAAVAVLGSLTVRFLIERKKNILDVVTVLVIFITIVASYYLFSMGDKHVTSAFMQGFFSEKISADHIVFLLSYFFIGFIAFIHMQNNNSKYGYVYLCALLYSQCILCYYVWQGHEGHLWMFSARFALPAMFYLAFITQERIKSYASKSLIYTLTTVFLLVLAIDSAKSYFVQKKLVTEGFKAHKVYHWSEPGTNFDSTMNPAYFKDSIDLIKKYSPEEQIYILSQYDFFLSFLAGKYSAMPHFDISGILLRNTEISLIENSIKTGNPQYIYVDSDIISPHIFDVLPIHFYGSWLHNESRLRAMSMLCLKNIFHETIQNRYELIEEGKIISVYKLKEAASVSNLTEVL